MTPHHFRPEFVPVESAAVSWLLPVLGGVLATLLVLGVAGLVLWRRGVLASPFRHRGQSPDEAARRVLAVRFARGEMDADDFLERASLLNWTPGAASPLPSARRQGR
jgi:putative membrane protein